MTEHNKWIDVTLEEYSLEDGVPSIFEYFYYFENGDYISYTSCGVYDDEIDKVIAVEIEDAYIYLENLDEYINYSLDGENLLQCLNLLDGNTEEILRDWFLFTYNTILKLQLLE